MDEDLSDYDPGGIYPGQPSNNKSDWIQEYNRIPVLPAIAANSHNVADDWKTSEVPRYSHPLHRKLSPIEELRESTDTETSDSEMFEDYDHQSVAELYDQMEFEWFEMKFSDEQARGVVNTAFDQYRDLQQNLTERKKSERVTNGAIRTVTTPQTICTEMSSSESLTELSGEVTKSPGSYFNDKHGQDEDVFSNPKVDRLELPDKLPAQRSLPILPRPPSIPETLAGVRPRAIRQTPAASRPTESSRSPAVCQSPLVPRPPKLPQPPLVPRPPKLPRSPIVPRSPKLQRPPIVGRLPVVPQPPAPQQLSQVRIQPSEPHPSKTKADVYNKKYAFWTVSFQNFPPSVASRPTVLPQPRDVPRLPKVSRPPAIARLPTVPRSPTIARFPNVSRPTTVSQPPTPPWLPEVPKPQIVPRPPTIPQSTPPKRLPEVPKPQLVPRPPTIPQSTPPKRLPEVPKPQLVPRPPTIPQSAPPKRLPEVRLPQVVPQPPTIPQSTPPKRLPEVRKPQLVPRPPTLSQPPEPHPSSTRPDVFNKKYAFWTVKF